jgi:hypothetical protein
MPTHYISLSTKSDICVLCSQVKASDALYINSGQPVEPVQSLVVLLAEETEFQSIFVFVIKSL